MKQPIRKNSNKIVEKSQPKKKVLTNVVKKVKKHPQYGTSKLEDDFAKQFLDKLGVKYQHQFEAKDIGRFYDFYCPEEHLIIEIDGDYWHGNPDKYSDDDLKWHQKKARRVDEHKNKWALMHGIPILRIWESDIRKNPKSVMKMLKETFHKCKEKNIIEENKKKRH